MLKNLAAKAGLVLAIAALGFASYGEMNKNEPEVREQFHDHGIVMGLASLFAFSFVRNKDSFEC